MFGGANIAFAEESGGFVGIGVGYGDTKMAVETLYLDTNETENAKDKANGVSYGFVAGYKQFFNEYLGLRYYANLDLTHAVEVGKFNTTLVNYGVNVDFLGNFVVTEIADFGGFIGLGIGGNTWTGKDIKDIKNSHKNDMELDEGGGTFKVKDTSFDVALNVGLRTNIAKYHGIELAVRVPFLKTRLFDVNFTIDGTKIGIKYDIWQNVRVLARYTFSF